MVLSVKQAPYSKMKGRANDGKASKKYKVPISTVILTSIAARQCRSNLRKYSQTKCTIDQP